jgi:AcrR family transcriptional regulator
MQETLLDAAAELFAEHGVEGTSLARIAERAGASRGLPNHHFRTKTSLIARLAQRAAARFSLLRLDPAMARARCEVDNFSRLDSIRVTADTYFEAMENPLPDERALIVMWGSTFPAAASVDGMLDAERRSYSCLADWVREGQREGSIRTDIDPAATGVLLHGFLRGVAAVLLTDPDSTSIRSLQESCHKWIMDALATQPSELTLHRAPAKVSSHP